MVGKPFDKDTAGLFKTFSIGSVGRKELSFGCSNHVGQGHSLANQIPRIVSLFCRLVSLFDSVM